MVKLNYAFKDFGSDTAKAYGNSLDISTKTSINVCNMLRGMTSEKALIKLQNIIDFKEAVPFTRFTDGVGHRRGKMASGRYPQKASKAFLSLLNSALANANNKGLSDNLRIVHICAHKASSPLHQGRQRRSAMKKTHIELVLKEQDIKKPSPKKVTKSVSKENSVEDKK